MSRGDSGTCIHICEHRPFKGQEFLFMKLKSNYHEGHLKLEHVSYLCGLSVNMQLMLQFLWLQLLLLLLLLLEHWYHVKSLLPLCSSHTANLHEASLFFPENFHKFSKSLYIMTPKHIIITSETLTYLSTQSPFCIGRVNI